MVKKIGLLAAWGFLVFVGGAPLAQAQTVKSVAFVDRNKDGRPGPGDTIEITYQELILFRTTTVDPAKVYRLSSAGDSFGEGATLVAGEFNKTTTLVARIVLGKNPKLRVSGTYDASRTQAGDPSGIDVLPSPLDHVVRWDGIARKIRGPLVATGLRDIAGTLANEPAPAHDFVKKAPLNRPRAYAAAVELRDGRVLVTGGLVDRIEHALDSELYDPIANAWTEVRSLSGETKGRMFDGGDVVKRMRPTATLLEDGRVLIVGGGSAAHVFEPATSSFTQVGSLARARAGHQASLLSDGKVLISGGTTTGGWALEVFDPATDRFTEIPTAQAGPEGHDGHSAAVFEHGKRVLLSGGRDLTPGMPTRVLADTAAFERPDRLAPSGGLVAARASHSTLAATFKEGSIWREKIVVAGGRNGQGDVGAVELLDPSTGESVAIEALAVSRSGATIVPYGGSLLVVGGGHTEGTGAQSFPVLVESLDRATSRLGTSGFRLWEGRTETCVVATRRGVLVIGGVGAAGVPIASSELLAPLPGNSNAVIRFMRPWSF